MQAHYPSLTGKRAFVSGAATGIGAAIVEALRGQRAEVAFVDILEPEGMALGASCGAHFSPCDVTVPGALARRLDEAAERMGGLDILVNNVANDRRHEAAAMTEEEFRAVLGVNLDPCFAAARAAYGWFVRNGGGAIINLSSINAILGPPDLAAYAAAKGAVNALTKSLARAWGRVGVRVNAVSPGWVATPRQLELWLTPEAEASWNGLLALEGRIAPHDVAAAVLFLAADDSRMITGQNLVVDAGRT
jgi:NAD(P)-dependent dehydrogenase (short-subunit alcohol dehydrogenase family)